jgi:hypothetical protein
MSAPRQAPRASVPLSVLNRQARERAYGCEDIDWARAADRARPWAPEGVGALWFVPSYPALDAAQRLRCNQLHALSHCEKLVWFEMQVVRAAGSVLRAGAAPAPLAEALRHFVQEEAKHIEMFRRLMHASEPEWYRRSDTRLFAPSSMQRAAMALVVDHPGTALVWVWLLIFIEERALYLARLYMDAARRAPGEVDALHADVHRFHFLDEVRHQHLGRHLLEWLYDSQPRWKKKVCAWAFRRAMRSYVAAGSAAPPILDQLAREFPGMPAALIARLRSEVARVARDPDYHRALFGRAAMPRTLALVARYPEHDALWNVLLGATKGEVLAWAH